MNSPRRHCMVVHAYYPIGETRVEREALALIQHGYEVDVVCLRDIDEPAYEVIDGVNIYRLPVTRDETDKGSSRQLLEYLAFFFRVFFQLGSLQRQRNYGVMQVHNLPDFLIFAALIPKMLGARLILDLHDLMPEFYAANFERPLDHWTVRLIRWQERISCRFADHVITVTDLWRKTLIERGVPAQKISVVMNAADERIFNAEERAKGKNDHGFRLIYHGTFAYRYGIDVAIRAVDRVRQQVPDIHLTVHGGGEYLSEMLELVGRLDLHNHVHFSTVFVPTTDLPKLIGNADAGIVPYRRNVFTDGILPTKLMEYVALGVPAIVARTPVIEFYFSQNMVQFFEAEDAEDLAGCILGLHSDRNRLAELAANADEFNHRYHWSTIAARYAKLVDQLNANIITGESYENRPQAG